MNFLISVLMVVMLTACSNPSYKEPHVIIKTSEGDIELELYPGQAPLSVAAFLSNVETGKYDSGAFYRVLMYEGATMASNTGLIQGGTWNNNKKEIIAGIPHESTKKTGLSHTSGMVSLARTGPGTAGTEFFICLGDQTQFDHGMGKGSDQEGFAAFGKVFRGMSVVRKIHAQPSNGESFEKSILIYSIKRI